MILAILILAATSTLFAGAALFVSLVNRAWLVQVFALIYQNNLDQAGWGLEELLNEEASLTEEEETEEE